MSPTHAEAAVLSSADSGSPPSGDSCCADTAGPAADGTRAPPNAANPPATSAGATATPDATVGADEAVVGTEREGNGGRPSKLTKQQVALIADYFSQVVDVIICRRSLTADQSCENIEGMRPCHFIHVSQDVALMAMPEAIALQAKGLLVDSIRGTTWCKSGQVRMRCRYANQCRFRHVDDPTDVSEPDPFRFPEASTRRAAELIQPALVRTRDLCDAYRTTLEKEFGPSNYDERMPVIAGPRAPAWLHQAAADGEARVAGPTNKGPRGSAGNGTRRSQVAVTSAASVAAAAVAAAATAVMRMPDVAAPPRVAGPAPRRPAYHAAHVSGNAQAQQPESVTGTVNCDVESAQSVAGGLVGAGQSGPPVGGGAQVYEGRHICGVYTPNGGASGVYEGVESGSCGGGVGGTYVGGYVPPPHVQPDAWYRGHTAHGVQGGGWYGGHARYVPPQVWGGSAYGGAAAVAGSGSAHGGFGSHGAYIPPGAKGEHDYTYGAAQGAGYGDAQHGVMYPGYHQSGYTEVGYLDRSPREPGCVGARLSPTSPFQRVHPQQHPQHPQHPQHQRAPAVQRFEADSSILSQQAQAVAASVPRVAAFLGTSRVSETGSACLVARGSVRGDNVPPHTYPAHPASGVR
jgi:hypothetical protein